MYDYGIHFFYPERLYKECAPWIVAFFMPRMFKSGKKNMKKIRENRIDLQKKLDKGKKMIQVKDLTKEQIDEICREIGDSFYDHDYGAREKGITKFIEDREMMFRYMRACFVASLKSGTVYSTGERGEGYIVLSGTKCDKVKISAALGMIVDVVKALGGIKEAYTFMKEMKKGGISYEDKLKKEKKDYLQVFMLVVRKEYQGQGYMRKLMEFAYEKADQYRVPCILDTDAKNKLEKYCHLGMEHVATRKIAADCFLYDLCRPAKEEKE